MGSIYGGLRPSYPPLAPARTPSRLNQLCFNTFNAYKRINVPGNFAVLKFPLSREKSLDHVRSQRMRRGGQPCFVFIKRVDCIFIVKFSEY